MAGKEPPPRLETSPTITAASAHVGAAATGGFPRKNTLAHVRPVKSLQNIRVLFVIEGVTPRDVTLLM